MKTANEYATASIALSDAYSNETLAWEEFHAQNKALWDEIWAEDERRWTGSLPGFVDMIQVEIASILEERALRHGAGM